MSYWFKRLLPPTMFLFAFVAAWALLGRFYTAEQMTHDIDEAIYLADRVAIMAPNPGHIGRDIDVHLPRSSERGSSLFQSYRLRRPT